VAGTQFETDTKVKQQPHGCSPFMHISLMTGYKPWCHGGTNA